MKNEDPTINIAEEMYAQYIKDPSAVDASWRDYFKGLDVQAPNPISSTDSDLGIQNLINAYRTHGHLAAKINPLQPDLNQEIPKELLIQTYGFSNDNLNDNYSTYGLLSAKKAPLKEIIRKLESIYCDKIGVEYMGLQNPELEKFIQSELENERPELTLEEKQMILRHLNKSELLEVFLHTKYVGQKRFSLEGGETLIPMLESVIEKGSEDGIEEFFIGMSHRGRLNVLSNILNKSYTELFREFDESYIPDSFHGSYDVKYHKGFSSEVKTSQDKLVKISVTSNPSHLESVDAVIEGEVKARQVFYKDDPKKVLAILIHGDAAVSGQGVVYETLQFCKLPGYSTGGTVHFVVNNQIGFTTVPKDSRSTLYCTDIAKTFGDPVFHVNVEEPESAVFASILALKVRQKFHIDVFIDLNCYRKYGHNETDEPAFTQPLEYQVIRKKRPVREIYRDQLINQSFLEKELAENLESEFRESLNAAQNAIQTISKKTALKDEHPNGKLPGNSDTAVSKDKLEQLAELFCTVPKNFNIHPKVNQLIKNRLSMVKENKPIDWGMAEHLSYATLLSEGTNIRISGQDSCRGTFSHRHGLFVDQILEKDYFPLKHLNKTQGRFDLYNSPLSEFAALGFEYGYSMMTLNDLTIWEAQFGDFANGAQVIIDQYIASAEQKWGQRSSLVLLLPHGYEGQGPEHSSGRLERFLSLAADNNMQIVNPTTPAQFFHLIRRQITQKIYKPLIVFTPKGLLRLPECVSLLSDFTTGSFLAIIDDPLEITEAKQLIFCSGRIYYDLALERKKNKIEDIALVRIEELYPLDIFKLKEILNKYSKIEKCFYVQEEPSNMGAFEYLKTPLNELLPPHLKLQFAGRKRSASPATGSHAIHKLEYEAIMSVMKRQINEN